ncbi:MAG: deoxyribose-phosphate aldolase [Ruminococcaceae bacterium]|jgi:deoxyribose-phosphate aldolase|nr:deoxyribose-phosphate aldolase [Oscillospiraceae bacterium]
MKIEEILSHVDHTLLAVDAKWDDIRAVIDDGIRYRTASACIPASYVKRAAEYAAGRVRICTVIGFPNGYSTPETKFFEAADAVKNGADEVDTVINVGWAKDGLFDAILAELKGIREAMDTAAPNRILKVIIETCLLTDEEIVRMCDVVAESRADYIKTSTGFSKAGATPHAVSLMASRIAEQTREPKLKIKAAGGISSLEDAELYLSLGADRLGTSRIVKIVKASEG